MFNRQTRITENRQWRLLFIYNIYRIISIVLFLLIYLFSPTFHPQYYFNILVGYFLCGLLFLYFWREKNLGFEKQVFLSGSLDVLIISILLNMIGNLQSGYGILLNATIAALSILVPGRLAIFFAAMASCLLLIGSIFQYFVFHPNDLNTFYHSGVYGAGFFATSITAWYLANWVQVSESIAMHRSEELAGMQRINEYIVERLHSGIIYVDEGQVIKLINSAARKFFGLHHDESPLNLRKMSATLAAKFENFLEKPDTPKALHKPR